MNKVKVKGVAAAVLTSLFCAVFTGCGEGTPDIVDIEKSTVYLTKDGTVTAYLVEDFDKDYYDVAELEQMIQREIEDYTSQAHAGSEEVPVKLIDICSPADKDAASYTGDGADTVTVHMEYEDASVYGLYNDCSMFFGTVKEAKHAGYPILSDLQSVSGDEMLGKDQAQAMGDKHILVLPKGVSVVVPYKVLYVTEGVAVEKDTVIFDGEGGEFALVIMK